MTTEVLEWQEIEAPPAWKGGASIHIQDYGDIALCGVRIKPQQASAEAGKQCQECIDIKSRMLGRFNTR